MARAQASCPVQAITLVFGTAKRGVELPQIDPDFQTNRPGVYIVGELGGMGLIRNAVSQGRQAADHIAASERRGTGDALDAVIIGAGPAGISATLRLMEEGLRIALLEREAFGGTITHYPRGKVVMTGPLDFPMYGRVSKRKMSKEELVELWDDIRDTTEIPVTTDARSSASKKRRTGTGSCARAPVISSPPMYFWRLADEAHQESSKCRERNSPRSRTASSNRRSFAASM